MAAIVALDEGISSSSTMNGTTQQVGNSSSPNEQLILQPDDLVSFVELLATQHHEQSETLFQQQEECQDQPQTFSNPIGEINEQPVDISNPISSLPRANKRNNLSEESLQACVQEMLCISNENKLPYGFIKKLAEKYNSNRWTVAKLWNKVQTCIKSNVTVKVGSNRKGRCGRKEIVITEEMIEQIPLKHRTTTRDTGAYLNVSHSTVHKNFKKGRIVRYNSCLKPSLTKENTIQRLQWCLSQIDNNGNEPPTFKDNYNVCHIDEKWFVLSKKRGKYYLSPRETRPHRTIKNKNYITKVMFLVATARPRFNEDGYCTFDGKIGCFPFVEMVPAKRTSRNRERGTLELKPIQHITREVIKNKFINELIPALKRKWPLEDNGVIYIQQDNATPHIRAEDEAFNVSANADGFQIKIIQQPPNSPDLNVLDLGFFSAIQSIQHKQKTKDFTQYNHLYISPRTQIYITP